MGEGHSTGRRSMPLWVYSSPEEDNRFDRCWRKKDERKRQMGLSAEVDGELKEEDLPNKQMAFGGENNN